MIPGETMTYLVEFFVWAVLFLYALSWRLRAQRLQQAIERHRNIAQEHRTAVDDEVLYQALNSRDD